MKNDSVDNMMKTANDKIDEAMNHALGLKKVLNKFIGNPMKLNIKRLTETAKLPTRAHPGDAGLDLYADESVFIEYLDRALVDTGISVEIPLGYVGLIWPRSGLAAKHGISVDAGVIDAGYRGPIKVLVTNSSEDCNYEVTIGEKIAQLLIQPVALLDVVEVDSLDSTARGEGGFGSTGV